MLDTNAYEWITPNTTTTIAPRNLHTANMFGNYMIVSFGKFYSQALVIIIIIIILFYSIFFPFVLIQI